MWNEATYIYKITHLEPTSCTIQRASIISGENGDFWAIHVNYTIPSSQFCGPHVSFLENTDIDTLYTVNSTIPCFYSTYDLNYASLSNEGASAVDIITMAVAVTICIPFVVFFLRGLVTCLQPLLLPCLVALKAIPNKIAQSGIVLTKYPVETMRKWNRFVPLAQSEEEAFSLESADEKTIPRDSPV
ncbi:hypothetical protein INT44_001491 [Umbelopsis vinacea]|uniref:Uncharacterized protein n=1 Tax=Umbelopsis vinacea TaxID=44442 RepID=A0A8H7UAG5_9FUNG|nr:hypothetical protein INT44_001491 [Umbelopsis vinacea]